MTLEEILASVRSVLRRFVTLIALLLTVVWLPAAQHCELEALGWLSEAEADESCCTPTAGCEQDACDLVENGGYQPSLHTVKVGAPALFALPGWVTAAVVSPALTLDQAGGQDHGDERTDWVPAWQFVRRAAPSPRAPTV